ncbi:hypothetical protein [Ekhidna sp.]|uniref:hypothetical protein n=1 Tax=Ekhidna sp. TaxID=2608089 RepID=UPI003515C3AF
MKRFVSYTSVAIFSIFIGSQITEGVLLVPYWKSLPASDFYSYYKHFGPSIGRFYTILTIIAALIPISISIYCKQVDSNALKLALSSSFFAILFIACFYIYFKDANELFYQASLSEIALKKELVTWSYWHWGRILLECASLIFLILSLIKIQAKNINQE